MSFPGRRVFLLLSFALSLQPAALGGYPDLPGPSSHAATETEALAAYYRGDVESCLQAYRQLLRREPENASARRSLVRVLRESGRLLEALEQLDLLLGSEGSGGQRARFIEADPGLDDGADLRPGEADLRLSAAETAFLAGQAQRSLRYLEPLEPSADSLYAAALALAELGRREEAASLLEQSLERQSFRPLGWYRLGLLRQELSSPDRAEEALRRALAQEPNITASFYPLARLYLELGQVQRAYGLLRRAEASLPNSLPIRELLQGLVAEHPELLEAAAQEQQNRREMATPRRAEASPAATTSLPLVRVGLIEAARELHLKTGGSYRLSAAAVKAAEGAAGSPAVQGSQGAAGTVLVARLVEGQMEVADAQGAVLLRSAAAVRLSYDDPADTTILFDVQFGQGSYWAGSEDRMYRGAIELIPRPGGLTAVNTLSVEEYLYAVLPSEMPSHWPQQALQAQAVAARSYTLANLGRYAGRGFDLLGSVSSAAYRGMSAETASVRGAVDATRGLVLLDGEAPLAAFYSANCGGHTDTPETAWGFASTLPATSDTLTGGPAPPLPPEELALFLSERPEAYCSQPDYSSRSAYRWQLWVLREEIENRLGLGEGLGRILSVVPGSRGVSGRVREVHIQGSAGEYILRGDALRSKLGGLRSSLFTVQPKLGSDGLPEYFLFTGGGWGHGVGLCQSGAAGMAAAGMGAEVILSHYYGGAPLRKLY